MAFSKRAAAVPTARDDVVIVVANLDPHSTRETCGTPRHAGARAGLPGHVRGRTTCITGQSWHWGEHVYVRLGPDAEPVHVVQIRRF